MIILNSTLSAKDYQFFVFDMKRLMLNREAKKQARNPLKSTQGTFEKNIVPLAEGGQIEAMQEYCETLSPVATMNSRIVSNFHRLEQKCVKEPRDWLALSSFYMWHVEHYKVTYNSINIENLEEYAKARDCYRKAGQMLYQIGKTDPIARESAFVMQKRNREELTPEEYRRSMSNSRNLIFATANRQTNDTLWLKLMIRYCQNLVGYASDTEYSSHQPTVSSVISFVQKRMIAVEEK